LNIQTQAHLVFVFFSFVDSE